MLLYDFADHKYEILSSDSWYKYDKCDIYHVVGKLCEKEDFECPICQKTGAQFTSQLVCGHNFCAKCINMWVQSAKTTCPMCRQNLEFAPLSSRI
jgi:hypothetical protein